MADPQIPTVDLSPFFSQDDEDGKKKAMEIITEACSEHGFFQIVNHGVPVDLLKRALQLSSIFFDYPSQEKLKSSAPSNAPIRTGYNTQPPQSPDKNEYLLIFPPGSSFNVFPQNPPQFKQVLQDVYSKLTKTAVVVEGIVNQCLDLPTNLLKEFNHDRSWDFMVALRYFPATELENNGLTQHEDGNCLSFVFQDDAGGLQVRKDGEWIPVIPTKGTLVVNLGDVIQVLSNNKFKSATHRVVRPKGRSRYSFAFFHNLQGDKWVEPLPHFTKDIGKPPKYRGFRFSEYQQLRVRNKTHPPSRPEDQIGITHYEIIS
ncbi:flavonol synthase/flavanone 3-hydroxylase-like [Hibiscus syriacus]|uniref:flavonol synthase/flavanone 3-hydroxylase-like n=1 Tax=Hibiscus syriacus TaxID=106335 RepID=UPI0019232086|nr:flavonol synthase/flavanone 3-hydroxylase-like [Hibiscus syriacus]